MDSDKLVPIFIILVIVLSIGSAVLFIGDFASGKRDYYQAQLEHKDKGWDDEGNWYEFEIYVNDVGEEASMSVSGSDYDKHHVGKTLRVSQVTGGWIGSKYGYRLED